MAQNPVIQRDFKPAKNTPNRKGIPYTHWVILLSSVILFGVIFFLISDIAVATRGANNLEDPNQYQKVSLHKQLKVPLDIPAYDESNVDDYFNAPNIKWKTVIVRKGDTLARIFSTIGISPKQLHKIVRLGKPTNRLKRLLPGEKLKFLVLDGELRELIYSIDEAQSLHVVRSGDTFTASEVSLELNKRIAYAAGIIETSLFLAAQQAGIPGGMTMELANIFNWDIDFVLDVKTGDRFSLIYEEYFLDGKKVRNGDILAAEFSNKGKVYRAVRYVDKNNRAEYYTPEGKSMRKRFLRTPVDFARISSKFGKRFHPVLNRMRQHKGVDYAAPRGTPIKASGDGKIKFIGKKGGYGNTIIVQHAGKYSTVYAHMKSFKRGLRKNAKIKQGDTIGYVGSSGLATGPHLHYEFRINGIHRNPLTVKLPDATPITAKYRTDFKLNTQGYLTLLNTLGRTNVALSSSSLTDRRL
ncbi:MAG: peptidoglycan DD-metalloendopeptidase family protein [Gammaproteobacteria bacterium]|nr:peptidoglycan DD-metalloendopeptidase family protein [Gammaproteobacteria bacterium]